MVAARVYLRQQSMRGLLLHHLDLRRLGQSLKRLCRLVRAIRVDATRFIARRLVWIKARLELRVDLILVLAGAPLGRLDGGAGCAIAGRRAGECRAWRTAGRAAGAAFAATTTVVLRRKRPVHTWWWAACMPLL